MQTMNEKKAAYVKAYPDRATEVQRRINNRNIVSPSQYTLQKKVGYVIVQNIQLVPPQRKPRLESPPVASTSKK